MSRQHSQYALAIGCQPDVELQHVCLQGNAPDFLHQAKVISSELWDEVAQENERENRDY